MEGNKRKCFLAANWKSNGNTAFAKDIVTNLFNTFDFDPSKLGTFNFLIACRYVDTAWTSAYVTCKSHGQRQGKSRSTEC